MKLNPKLQQHLKGYQMVNSIKGRLKDDIYQYTSNSGNSVYLKVGRGVAGQSLQQEAFVVDWLSNKDLVIPRVLYFEKSDDSVSLLISGVAGTPPYKLKERDKEELLKITALALRKFHSVSLNNSENLNNLDKDLAKIEKHIKLDVIDVKIFQESNEGKTPEEIYSYLLENKTKFDSNVLTHGDYCLTNILITQEQFGFIDLGDCGPGDRYKDFSSLEVSIKRNFGAEWIPIFYKHYDQDLTVDPFKIKYFQLIDQFSYHLDLEKYLIVTKSER
jgi:aminoglycoside phosphotransferase